MKFMVIVCAAFLARVNPVSTIAKPACMNITRNPATNVHTKLIATVFAAEAALAALRASPPPAHLAQPLPAGMPESSAGQDRPSVSYNLRVRGSHDVPVLSNSCKNCTD